MRLLRIEPDPRESADVLRQPDEQRHQDKPEQQRHRAMHAPDLEMDRGEREQQRGPAEQQQPAVEPIVVGEEVEIDRCTQTDQPAPRRMAGEAEIEQPPDAAEIAADARIHEAGKQRHATDPDQARLGIDPRAGRGLEQLHGRADEMIDQDDLGLLPGLQARSQQRGLDGEHAEEEKVIARERRIRRIEPPCQQHQRHRDAAEKAGPSLLHTEAEEFVEEGGPGRLRGAGSETCLGSDEGVEGRPSEQSRTPPAGEDAADCMPGSRLHCSEGYMS